MRALLYSVALAAAICVASAYRLPFGENVAIYPLVLGPLAVYAATSNYLIVFSIKHLQVKFSRLSGAVAVIAAFIAVVVLAWVVFGVYFITVTQHGFLSDHDIVLDVFLKRVLSIQKVTLPVVALMLTRWRTRLDAVFAILIVLMIFVFTISSPELSF